MLSRFHLLPERNGQTRRRTDGRTDRFAISISLVISVCRCAIKTKEAIAAIVPSTEQHVCECILF